MRRPYQDEGRSRLSGDAADAGAMKTPSLRNAALRASFMHTGEFHSLSAVVDHYVTPKAEAAPLPGTTTPYKVAIDDLTRQRIIDFITEQLTDPRVAAETFPFDRPTLRSERADGQATAPGSPGAFKAAFMASGDMQLTWAAPPGGASDYLLVRDGEVIAVPTQPGFLDQGPEGRGLSRWSLHLYKLVARNAGAKASPAAYAVIGAPVLGMVGGGLLLAAVIVAVKRWRSKG